MFSTKLSNSLGIIIAVAVIMLAAFSIRFVAAQTATSSDSTASSTDTATIAATSSDTGTVADEATTTSSSDTPSTTSTQPSDTSATSPATSETSAVATSPSITTSTRDEIAGLEESYRRQSGKYLQVLPGNQIPPYESGTVADKLGKNIPDNMRIDIYEAATGMGYQISYEDSGTTYSFGYGPEAAQRTFTVQIAVPESATSTPSVL